MGSFNGTGTTLALGDWTGEVLDIRGPNISKVAIDFSHLGSWDGPSDAPFRTYVLGRLIEGGEITFSVAYDPANPPPIVHSAGVEGFALDCTITFPADRDGSAITTLPSFKGGVTNFAPTVPLEGRATADVTVKVLGKISGIPSVTPAA